MAKRSLTPSEINKIITFLDELPLDALLEAIAQGFLDVQKSYCVRGDALGTDVIVNRTLKQIEPIIAQLWQKNMSANPPVPVREKKEEFDTALKELIKKIIFFDEEWIYRYLNTIRSFDVFGYTNTIAELTQSKLLYLVNQGVLPPNCNRMEHRRDFAKCRSELESHILARYDATVIQHGFEQQPELRQAPMQQRVAILQPQLVPELAMANEEGSHHFERILIIGLLALTTLAACGYPWQALTILLVILGFFIWLMWMQRTRTRFDIQYMLPSYRAGLYAQIRSDLVEIKELLDLSLAPEPVLPAAPLSIPTRPMVVQGPFPINDEHHHVRLRRNPARPMPDVMEGILNLKTAVEHRPTILI
jgi:hypothetical protein